MRQLERIVVRGRRGVTNTRRRRLSSRLRRRNGSSVCNFAQMRVILLAGAPAHLGRRVTVAALFLGIGAFGLGVVVVSRGFCWRHDEG